MIDIGVFGNIYKISETKITKNTTKLLRHYFLAVLFNSKNHTEWRNENNIDSKSSKDFLEFSVFWEISNIISALGNYRAEIQETLDRQVSKIQCSKRDS